MNAFFVLSVAAGVVQLIKIGARLEALASICHNEKLSREQIEELSSLILDLDKIGALLNLKIGSNSNSFVSSGAEKEFLNLISRAESDARSSFKCINKWKAVLEDRPVEPSRSREPPKPGEPSRPVSTFQIFDKYKEKQEYTKYLQELETWTEKASAIFLLIWVEDQLNERCQAFLSYKVELNPKLIAVLTPNNSFSSTRNRLSAAGLHQPHNNEEQIVEVLCVNDTLAAGLEAIAAVLIKRNGESVTVVHPDLRIRDIVPNQAGDLISYHLEGHSSSFRATDGLRAPFKPAQILTTSPNARTLSSNAFPTQRSANDDCFQTNKSTDSYTDDCKADTRSSNLGSNNIRETENVRNSSSNALYDPTQLSSLPNMNEEGARMTKLAFEQGSHNFGDVSVSGNGNAHLGDNNFHGAVTIEKLIFVSGADQRYGDSNSSSRVGGPGFGYVPAEQEGPQATSQIRVRHPTEVVDEIKSVLRFAEEGYRHSDIRDAHHRTFGWILRQSQQDDPRSFWNWLTKSTGCFWVQGKAGSGKSTLMKYLFQQREMHGLLQYWAHGKHLIIATFWFWHAGTPLQRSYEGILRSLLRQVLEQIPSLAATTFPRLYVQLLDTKHTVGSDLSIRDLQMAIDILIREIPHDVALFLMIDGLDEYSGDLFEFCKLFVRFAASPNIKILVSSRPIPMCYDTFSQYPGLRLQDLTVNDIHEYINEELIQHKRLQEVDRCEPGTADKILRALTDKASGVFLWIIIVVRKLIIGLVNHDYSMELMAKIDELPNELESLYDHMFAKMSSEYRKDGSRLLQYTYRACQVQIFGLDALQLFFADHDENLFDYPPAMAKRWTKDDELSRVQYIAGRLRSRCCGLVELQHRRPHSSRPRVDFLHRTVVEYLRRDSIWQDLRSLHGPEERQIDMILLAASVRVLRWSTTENPESHLDSYHNVIMFQTCLTYSKHLNANGDSSHVNLLLEGDKTFLSQCESQRRSNGRYYYYNKAFNEFDFAVEAKSLLVTGNTIGTTGRADDPSSMETAIFCLAYGGLSEFLDKKLATNNVTSAEVGLVLCRIVSLFINDSSSTSLADLWPESCRVLLRCCNPNYIVIQVTGMEGPHWRSAANLSDSQEGTSPWGLWLAYLELSDMHNIRAWYEYKITSNFLQAGADRECYRGRREAVLRDLGESTKYWLAQSESVSERTRTALHELQAILGLGRKGAKRGPGQKEKKWHIRSLSNRFRSRSKETNDYDP